MPVDIPAFAATQLELLAAELQAEVTHTAETVGGHTPAALQRAGLALTNLTVAGQRTGMGGRTVLTLEVDAATGGAKGPSKPTGKAGAKATKGSSKGSSKATSKGSKAKPTSNGGDDDSGGLPEHGLRTGDVVLVAEQPGGSAKKREMRELEQRGVHGVITRIRRYVLEVAVDDRNAGSDNEDKLDGIVASSRVWLLKLADEVTYRRMSSTMRQLREMPEAAYTPLTRVLFGLSAVTTTPSQTSAEDIAWIDESLNDSQKDAVRFALAAQDVALIHGPPGTGKTHTLVELILQMVRRGLRVLVCGPSNIAVDNLVERLAPHSGVPMVRLGHPARLLPSVLGHSLDVLTQTSAAGAIVKDVRADMDSKQAELKKLKPKERNSRRAIYNDLRDLRKEYRERERRCVQELVGGSAVVLATLHGAGGSQLRGPPGSTASTGPGGSGAAAFDVVVIDEASQALEAQCWVPLLTARKAVLAGDHLQLPPTVKNKDKAKKAEGTTTKTSTTTGATTGATTATTLEHTLFDRLLDLHGASIKRMLTTQYRMHERIMRFPSDTLYEGKLQAADAVAQRLLRDIKYEDGTAVADADETREPLVFIDTQGGEFREGVEDVPDAPTKKSLLGDSKCNPMEVLLVKAHVQALIQSGLRASDIAVITPYNAQLALLAAELPQSEFAGIELGSVDGFQGREKEAVVVSLVRSNDDGDVGFLAEKRRLNVAMTRPKRSLTVIGDSETVKKGSAFLRGWMAFLEEHADLRYPDASAVVAV
ncbi:dna helicase [Ophiostoma piceae UAMH 11346]|uniref:DNA helicase n=1 Tax=Ophiostoma piceae (strain UAMH 11346) TaxID=1262450 RepID=S3CVQ3_OPHP1|nr:dna helicase [Ophiostoma piceae UAMH 11346]